MVKQTAPLSYIPDEFALTRILAFLNDGHYRQESLDDAGRAELQGLVEDWLAVKGHWGRFLARRLRAGKLVSFSKGTFNLPSEARDPILVPFPAKDTTHAEGVFFQFILHPDRMRLSGPCCRRECARYFLRKTAHIKLYCTARCASLVTAAKALKANREIHHAKQMALATEAITAWQHTKHQGNWKPWVVARIERQGEVVTAKALTRWVNNGELKAPERKG